MANFLSSNADDLTRSLMDQKRGMEEQQAQHAAGSLNLPHVNLQNFPMDLNALA